MKTDRPIQRVLLEEGADNYDLCAKILKKVRGAHTEKVTNLGRGEETGFSDMDKETLRLVDFRGEFLKPCPGTSGYICCGYQILNVGTNCPMDCSYCILQAYFNQPSLRVFANLKEKLNDIASLLDSTPHKLYRIGTGEFTDSLALDPITGWSQLLIPFFAERRNAVLELKTKTDRIEGVLSSSLRERIIISWSLNSPYIASKEEHGAPAIKKRLAAARKCQTEGYAVGFHFDPLVEHRNWRDGYRKTLDLMDKFIDPRGVVWISLGCLRYMPILKPIIRERHPGTHILDGEFVPGLDGKMRYFKPIRIDLYTFVGEMLKQWYGEPGVYLCMESDGVWRESLGWSPVDSRGLSDYLDQRVAKFFGIGSYVKM